MQLLAGAGPGQGQRFPGESWSRPRLWPNSWAMEEATPRMLVEWSCGGGELRSSAGRTAPVLSPGTSWAPSRHHLPQLLPEESSGLVVGNLGSVLAPSPSLAVWPGEVTSALWASAAPRPRRKGKTS